MATTTKRVMNPPFIKKMDERLAALEQEVYGKRTDSEYFDFWGDIATYLAVAIILVTLAILMVLWIK